MENLLLYQIKLMLSHGFFPFFILFAGIYDVLTFRIPNWLNLLGLLGFVITYIAFWLPIDILLWSILGAFLVLVAGFVMFAYNLIGAGDIKLATVCALWLGFEALLSFILLFTLIGGVLGIFVLLLRKIPAPLAAYDLPLVKRLMNLNKLPYGLAISLAAIAVYMGYFGYSASIFIASL